MQLNKVEKTTKTTPKTYDQEPDSSSYCCLVIMQRPPPHSPFTLLLSYLIVSCILPDPQNPKTISPFLLSADDFNSYFTDQSEENFHKLPNVYQS